MHGGSDLLGRAVWMDRGGEDQKDIRGTPGLSCREFLTQATGPNLILPLESLRPRDMKPAWRPHCWGLQLPPLSLSS